MARKMIDMDTGLHPGYDFWIKGIDTERTTVKFSIEQVAALCGGKLPETGFSWSGVGHFLLEDGILQPYALEEILPGPGIMVNTQLFQWP
jgi:hypothetical protein